MTFPKNPMGITGILNLLFLLLFIWQIIHALEEQYLEHDGFIDVWPSASTSIISVKLLNKWSQ